MIPQRIVAFGGSNLFGLIDPKGGGFIGRLKTYHEGQDVHNMVFNLGISGETTTDILKRLLPEAAIRKPDLIIIAIGLNDTKRIGGKTGEITTPKEQFEDNIKMLIKQAQSLSRVILLSHFPPVEEKTAPLTYWNKSYYYLKNDAIKYMQIVKEICDKEKIPYLDIFNKWIKKDYSHLLFIDGIHANEKGHSVIFEDLKAFLKQLIVLPA